MMRTRPKCSREEILSLGVSTTLVKAAAAIGIGRTTAHKLAREGQFPIPVELVGNRYVVPTEPLLKFLHLDSVSDMSAA